MKTVTLAVRREDAGKVGVDRFDVEARSGYTVLDALLAVVREQDPSLSLRFSCRVGMCGTCAVVVDGREALACQTPVADVGRRISVGPLRNLPVVKDLVVDLGPFFDRYRAISPAAPQATGHGWGSTFGDCVTCGLCVSACTMVTVNPGFVGPAALFRAARLVAEAAPDERARRLAEVAVPFGAFGCRGHLDCVAVCPKGLPLADAIASLKRAAAFSALRRPLARVGASDG